MPKDKFMRKCFFCGTEFQHGPHRYDGEYLERYKVWACRTCFDWNRDGWADPIHVQKLETHLQEQGLPVPEKNENGWLPR